MYMSLPFSQDNLFWQIMHTTGISFTPSAQAKIELSYQTRDGADVPKTPWSAFVIVNDNTAHAVQEDTVGLWACDNCCEFYELGTAETPQHPEIWVSHAVVCCPYLRYGMGAGAPFFASPQNSKTPGWINLLQ